MSVISCAHMQTVTAHSAGGLVVDEDGKLVLTSRKSFRGDIQWGLPKGIIEKGEKPEEAAIRETREETGLEVEIIRSLHPIEYWYVQPAREGSPPVRVHKFVHFFLMRATGGDPSAHDAETEEVGFFEATDAIKRSSFSSEKKLIRQAIAAGLE
ncbi:MAG TPA: NUDIX domain-containing protein [Actinomycetota bacterium]|nr:NUDIX domain-containing protein [Actinomycetota bacterium]